MIVLKTKPDNGTLMFQLNENGNVIEVKAYADGQARFLKVEVNGKTFFVADFDEKDSMGNDNDLNEMLKNIIGPLKYKKSDLPGLSQKTLSEIIMNAVKGKTSDKFYLSGNNHKESKTYDNRSNTSTRKIKDFPIKEIIENGFFEGKRYSVRVNEEKSRGINVKYRCYKDGDYLDTGSFDISDDNKFYAFSSAVGGVGLYSFLKKAMQVPEREIGSMMEEIQEFAKLKGIKEINIDEKNRRSKFKFRKPYTPPQDPQDPKEEKEKVNRFLENNRGIKTEVEGLQVSADEKEMYIPLVYLVNGVKMKGGYQVISEGYKKNEGPTANRFAEIGNVGFGSENEGKTLVMSEAFFDACATKEIMEMLEIDTKDIDFVSTQSVVEFTRFFEKFGLRITRTSSGQDIFLHVNKKYEFIEDEEHIEEHIKNFKEFVEQNASSIVVDKSEELSKLIIESMKSIGLGHLIVEDTDGNLFEDSSTEDGKKDFILKTNEQILDFCLNNELEINDEGCFIRAKLEVTEDKLVGEALNDFLKNLGYKTVIIATDRDKVGEESARRVEQAFSYVKRALNYVNGDQNSVECKKVSSELPQNVREEVEKIRDLLTDITVEQAMHSSEMAEKREKEIKKYTNPKDMNDLLLLIKKFAKIHNISYKRSSKFIAGNLERSLKEVLTPDVAKNKKGAGGMRPS